MEKIENSNINIKRRILVVCQYYKPEPFRIADICEKLSTLGNDVMVVTGYPNYPEGEIYEGYGKGKRIDEVVNGVRVHRCFTVPRKKGVINRIKNYYSFSQSSKRYVLSDKCKSIDGKNFDVVFCNQLSPVLMANAAIAYKKKNKISMVLYCLDLWPESLIAGGVKRKSIIFKIFTGISKRIYKSADCILVSSFSFMKYFVDTFRFDSNKMKYLPQYAEDMFLTLGKKENTDCINLVFAGNIGEIQAVDSIIDAAEILINSKIMFHIVGGGSDYERISERAKNLTNVIFHGRKPIDEMPMYYGIADAMLVSLKNDQVISMTLPGKIQSYMAAGKPIIGVISGEAKEIIEKAGCGFCGEAENVELLVENIKKFVELSCEEREELGKKSREYYLKNFSKDIFFNTLIKELNR